MATDRWRILAALPTGLPGHEGSIPFARSFYFQLLMQVCGKNKADLSIKIFVMKRISAGSHPFKWQRPNQISPYVFIG
jgi:hypothetical protein